MKRLSSRVALLLVAAVSLSFTTIQIALAQPVKLENVVSIQVISGRPGHDKLSPLYQKSDVRGKMIIEKIVGWINTAKPAEGQLGSSVKGGHPPFIQINTRSDELLRVSPAWNCEHVSLYTTCRTVINEIVVSNETGGRRIWSPQLFQWLKDGWKTSSIVTANRRKHQRTSQHLGFSLNSRQK